MSNTYDLTFIGSGISTSYTLLHLINRLLDSNTQKVVWKLLVIEKADEFWTGVPYGERSGYSSLIITPLKDFIPEQERELFYRWLQENFEQLKGTFLDKGSSGSKNWYERNRRLICKGDWDNIYIPRHFFGKFLIERVNRLLEQAAKKGLLTYDLLQAEVTDLERKRNGYVIEAVNAQGAPIKLRTKKAILSIGSPPKQDLGLAPRYIGSTDYCFINDTYEPNLDTVFQQISAVLQNSPDFKENNLLILGSNAGALEVLYLIKNSDLLGLINTIYMMSPAGKIPYLFRAPANIFDYQLENLNALREHGPITARNLFEAVKADVVAADAAGIPFADIHKPISSAVVNLLDQLTLFQQKQFVSTYGTEIGKYQRRAGYEYLQIVDELRTRDKLKVIPGRFTRELVITENGLQIHYLSTLDGDRKATLPAPIRAVVNCTGFQTVNNSTNRLIRQLIHKNICQPTESERGFTVNERFEANHNLYVMGPLLAGNLNKKLLIWHAESCPRIFTLSKQLAEVLMEDEEKDED